MQIGQHVIKVLNANAYILTITGNTYDTSPSGPSIAALRFHEWKLLFVNYEFNAF